MHPNEALISRFYDAFQRRDAAAMGACYHRDVHFSDEIFPELHGDAARAMWTMLCERGKDLTIECSAVHADGATGRAHWDAWYTFSGTGRRIHNRIRAEFTFADGLIVRHRDRFGFWRWARQALGPAGYLLGWSGFLHRRVQSQAARSLREWAHRARTASLAVLAILALAGCSALRSNGISSASVIVNAPSLVAFGVELRAGGGSPDLGVHLALARVTRICSR